MPRFCKNCGVPNRSIYDHYCGPCRPLMKKASVKRCNKRHNDKLREEKKALRLSKISDTYVQSERAKRLTIETPEETRQQAVAGVLAIMRGFCDIPEEGTQAQAMYRQMMGRRGAIGGIA